MKLNTYKYVKMRKYCLNYYLMFIIENMYQWVCFVLFKIPLCSNQRSAWISDSQFTQNITGNRSLDVHSYSPHLLPEIVRVSEPNFYPRIKIQNFLRVSEKLQKLSRMYTQQTTYLETTIHADRWFKLLLHLPKNFMHF